MRIANPLQNPARLSALGTHYSIDLNGQRLTQTWMTIMTPGSSSSDCLALGELLTCVLGLMLDVHSVSSKQKSTPCLSNPRGKALASRLTHMQAQTDQLLVEQSIPNPIREVLSETPSLHSRSASPQPSPYEISKCQPFPYTMGK